MPHFEGHRQRLKVRFQNAGPRALADYEILELFLFLIIPRGDVKPLAKELLKKFGSIEGLVAADSSLILDVPGAGPSVAHGLKVYQALLQRQLQQKIIKKPIITSIFDVITYMHAQTAYSVREEVWIIFLNRRNQIIMDEQHQVGTVDESPLFPREVIKRALEVGAKAILLVHNHPSGEHTPSSKDIDMTRRVKNAGKTMGIELLDHYIISKEGFCSLRTLGELD
jgi:DNA repair protein RadC